MKNNAGRLLGEHRAIETKKCPVCSIEFIGLVNPNSGVKGVVKLCRRCYINQYRREQRAKIKQLQGE